MLAENVNRASAGLQEKSLVFRTIALESTLPPHSDGAARRVSERIESGSRPQREFLLHDLLACPSPVQDASGPHGNRAGKKVRRHQSFEMPLIEDDHVVQQVASATSYPALSNTVLPRTAKGRASWLASPQVGFSANMRTLRARTSLLTPFRPPTRLNLEIPVQYKRNPAPCQFTTLRGVTKTRGFLHPDQT